MTSRPRPSLLALFDPLTIASASPSTPTRDAASPDSGSDKENTISTTPKYSCPKSKANTVGAYGGNSTCSRMDQSLELLSSEKSNLLGSSFSIDAQDDDTSNLCLVQLADELANACKIPEDYIDREIKRSREPLSEIPLPQNNDNLNRTPQSLARGSGKKRLINLSTTPTTTPKSVLKFAAGVARFEPATLQMSPSLAGRRVAPTRTPRSVLRPKVNSPSFVLHTPPNAANADSVYPAPSLPFASHSPSMLSSIPTADSAPAFQDPPSDLRCSSFDISGSLCMKQMNLSGDLLKDDVSFLARHEDDSFADFSRGNDSGGTGGSSPRPRIPQDVDSEHKPVSPQKCEDVTMEDRMDTIRARKAETPARKASTIFRRAPSQTKLAFETESSDARTNLTSSPIRLLPRTPSSASSPSSGEDKTFAPRKKHSALRGSRTLSRSSSGHVKDAVSAKDYELDVAAQQRQTTTTTTTTREMLRSRRPSSTEIKPLSRSLSQVTRQAEAHTVQVDTSLSRARSRSITRLSIGRRASIGLELSSSSSSSFSRIKSSDPKLVQDHIQKSSHTLTQSVRRLSVSSTVRQTPIKETNFATTGRVGGGGGGGGSGGARRVPLTSNAPLFFNFKASEPAIPEAPSPNSKTRAVASVNRTSPQRPRPLTSSTMGRSGAVRPVFTTPAPISGIFEQVPFTARKTETETRTKARTFSRASSASSLVFSRSGLGAGTGVMTNSGSMTGTVTAKSGSMTSRLPMKGGVGRRFPGSGAGARKTFS